MGNTERIQVSEEELRDMERRILDLSTSIRARLEGIESNIANQVPPWERDDYYTAELLGMLDRLLVRRIEAHRRLEDIKALQTESLDDIVWLNG